MMQTDDNSRLDFLRAQVLTSRNIRGSWWADIICRSLNYQIEHHLFPTMARNRMTQANKIVREYCEQVGVAYPRPIMLMWIASTLSGESMPKPQCHEAVSVPA